MRHAARALITLAITISLSACGTHVPEMQNFWEKRDVGLLQVEMLKLHTTCEVIQAVQSVLYMNDQENKVRAENGLKTVDLNEITNWVVEVLLTLTVEEKTQFNPAATLNAVYPNVVDLFKTGAVTIGQSGTLGLAGNVSADGTRKITVAFGINLHDYLTGSLGKRLAKASADGYLCFKPGSTFTDGDLKFRETLENALVPAQLPVDGGTDFLKELRIAEKATKKDVISHEVTFVVIYGAGITPSIKLVNVIANGSSSPFFGVQRTNTQDVLITMGPPNSGAIASTLLSTQINIGTKAALSATQNQ